MFMFGVFRKRGIPNVDIVSDEDLQDGSARVGDLARVIGGCPRYPGDRVDLVGGYKAVVVEYNLELFYCIVP